MINIFKTEDRLGLKRYKANIDLSWLGEVLTPPPGANPLLGATQGDDGLWRDPSGNVINNGGQTIDQQDTVNPYQTPGFWQRAFQPQASQYASSQNAAYATNPTFSQQKTSEDITDRQTQLAALAKNYNVARGLDPNDPQGMAAVQAGGELQTKTGVLPTLGTQYQQAGDDYSKGIGTIGSITDIANATGGMNNAFANESAAGNRARVVQPLINQTDVANANTGLTLAKGNQANAPFQVANQSWETQNGVPAEMMKGYVEATHPGLGGTGLNMLNINPSLDNPSVNTEPNALRTPMMDMMGRAIGGGGSGGINNLPMKSQGNGISIPPLSYSLHGQQPTNDIDNNPYINSHAAPTTIGSPAASLANVPLVSQAHSNNLPAAHLEDAENLLKSSGLLHDEELYTGTGRNMRRIPDSKEESLIKSRIPLLMKTTQNPHMRPAQRAIIGQIANQFE